MLVLSAVAGLLNLWIGSGVFAQTGRSDAAPLVSSESQAKDGFLANQDARRGARVEIVLDKEEYFLGENVVLHWRVWNAGKEPFRISMGGDGRNSIGRALRFKVEAIGPQGKAEDPYPSPMCFGGLYGEPTLQPRGEFWDDLQLMLYREPGGPGTFTIRVYHDLGWDQSKGGRPPMDTGSGDIPEGTRTAPLATATLRLVMPNEQQARQVVDAMLKLSTDPNRIWGQRGRPFADFRMLRYPVYLPIVKEMAEKGDERVLEAIGGMAFPEATEAILDLSEHKTSASASKAEQLLLERAFGLDPRWRWQSGRQAYLAQRGWREDLKARAAKAGWRLLAKEDRESRIRGARLIQLLGNKDDLPALVQAMDKLLVAYKNDETEQRAYLRPATVGESLTNAANELVKRGAQPAAAITTPGETAAFLVGLKSNENFRPAGWQAAAEASLEHEIPFLRALALESLPLPLSDAAASTVANLLKDAFPPVQGAACKLAEKSKLPRFQRPLMDLLRLTSNEWLLRAAFRAATSCGADMDTPLEILVARLERHTNDRNMVVLGLLIDGALDRPKSYGAQDHADWGGFLAPMQKAWRELIDANRQALRDGRRFPVGQPPLKREMFPPQFQFHPPGQPPWPDWGKP
jgi:hypothetical protein